MWTEGEVAAVSRYSYIAPAEKLSADAGFIYEYRLAYNGYQEKKKKKKKKER